MSNPLNQYAKVNTTNYTYDPNGNLTNDGTYSYTYDCENRLLLAQSSNNIGRYRYDYLGRRAYRQTGTSSLTNKRYYYAGDDLIAEYGTSGIFENKMLKKYIYGPGIDEPIMMISVSYINLAETQYYYHYDGLGSVVALSSGSTGAIAEKYSYDAYGKVTIRLPNDTIMSSSQYGNRFMFTGREYDSETGNYYYRARYYSPKLGRFLQTDPIGYYDSMNLYQYCGNNPVNWTDPFGLFYFEKRPLMDGKAPWVPIYSDNPIGGYFNTELSHEHGFFEDKKGGNIGFGPNGRFSEDPTGKGYRDRSEHYDDDIMREALKRVKDGEYSNKPWKKNNCQDWADRLRKEYNKIKKERQEAAKDKIKKDKEKRDKGKKDPNKQG